MRFLGLLHIYLYILGPCWLKYLILLYSLAQFRQTYTKAQEPIHPHFTLISQTKNCVRYVSECMVDFYVCCA